MSLLDAQKAHAMIQRAKARGRAVDITFRRTTEGYVDPHSGTYTEGSDTTFTGTAVVLPVNESSLIAFDNRIVDGTLVESKLRGLLIAAYGMTHAPQPRDLVEFPDGAVGTLIGVTSLDPDAANPIIYQGTVQL